MERRVLLSIFLAFLVLYTWQALFVKPVPKPAATSPAGTSAPASTGTASSDPASTAAAPPVAAAEGSVVTPPPEAAPALVAETAERDVRIETREVIALFTNRGARLKSWRLKRYHN